jgi:competence protein ComFC
MSVEVGKSVLQIGNKVSWLDYLFPRFCFGCNKEGVLWCNDCQEGHLLYPGQQECPFCAREGFVQTCSECNLLTHLDGLFALSPYGDPVIRRAIRLWKYAGDQEAVPVIEKFVRAYVVKRHLTFVPECISFVPLHKRKKRLRGFDQAEQIAAIVSSACGREKKELLIREKMTTSQASIDQSSRLVGDLDDIFSVRGEMPKKVLLCDDVFTSGSTMDAAAKCLKQAGVEEVWGFVLAKGSTGK